MRFRSLAFLLTVLLALALAVLATGCGADAGGSGGSAAEDAPDFGTLVSEMLETSEEVKSAHYVVDVMLSVETDGEVSDPISSALAANPISVHVEGDASEQAFTASGSVSFLGQTLSGEILGGENELYVNFLETWYGTTDLGLVGFADAAQGGLGFETESGAPTPEGLLDQLDQIIAGEISDGPEVDGAQTWRVEGRLNSSGIAELAETYGGEAIPSEALLGLDALGDSTTLVMLVGRDDGLPRTFEMAVDISAENLEGFGGGDEVLGGLTSFKLEVSGAFSDFGAPVTYEAPAAFEPIEELLGQFGGLDLGSELFSIG